MKWIYDAEDDFHNVGGKCYVTDENGGDVCVAETKGIATLISAAPDLLEAAKELRQAFLDGCGEHRRGKERARLVAAGAKLDAAIARAEPTQVRA